MFSGSCLTSKLHDKIIKMPSKSQETFPLSYLTTFLDMEISVACSEVTLICSIPHKHFSLVQNNCFVTFLNSTSLF
jgi:hypothetical protein